jgi:hypothetical protein
VSALPLPIILSLSRDEQIEVECIVALVEEGALAAVAALGDVVGDAWQDQGREASHGLD